MISLNKCRQCCRATRASIVWDRISAPQGCTWPLPGAIHSWGPSAATDRGARLCFSIFFCQFPWTETLGSQTSMRSGGGKNKKNPSKGFFLTSSKSLKTFVFDYWWKVGRYWKDGKKVSQEKSDFCWPGLLQRSFSLWICWYVPDLTCLPTLCMWHCWISNLLSPWQSPLELVVTPLGGRWCRQGACIPWLWKCSLATHGDWQRFWILQAVWCPGPGLSSLFHSCEVQNNVQASEVWICFFAPSWLRPISTALTTVKFSLNTVLVLDL